MREVEIAVLEEWGANNDDHVDEGRYRITEKNGQQNVRDVSIVPIWEIVMQMTQGPDSTMPTYYMIPQEVYQDAQNFDNFIRRTGKVNQYVRKDRTFVEMYP